MVRERVSCCIYLSSRQSNLAVWPCTSSRVPKELISRFVKICPTCQVRRGGSHLSPPDSRRNSPPMELARVQPPQSPLAYMHAQPVPPMAGYDEYRRNSSSSSSYNYSDRGNRDWEAYSSPTSRHSEMAWSPPQNHQHHHHHGSRQDAVASSPPSRSMAGENSPSQAQYLSGYVATHSNSRYRPGY